MLSVLILFSLPLALKPSYPYNEFKNPKPFWKALPRRTSDILAIPATAKSHPKRYPIAIGFIIKIHFIFSPGTGHHALILNLD